MKLYPINLGYLESRKGDMFPGESDEITLFPVMAFLIDTGSEYILYDTGCHPDANNGHWPPHHAKIFRFKATAEQQLLNRLAQIGVKPEDIRKVVLSHMHLDHMGGVGLFPEAEVWAPEADYVYAQTLVHLTTDVLAHKGYIRSELDTPVKQYYLVKEDFELVPGIDVINLPGHTPGLLGLVVKLDGGAVILPQDSINAEWNYLPASRPSPNMFDEEAYYASIEKVRALQKKYNARIFYAHDGDFYQNIRHLPEYYE